MLRWLIALCLALVAGASSAETKYIDDTLYLGFYQNADGSGGQFTSAPSGTKLTLIETRGEYSRVRTEKGTEGWVKTKYLIDTPPAVVRIKALEAVAERADALAQEVEVLTDENNFLRKELDALLLKPIETEEQQLSAASDAEALNALTAQNSARQQRIEELEATIRTALEALVGEHAERVMASNTSSDASVLQTAMIDNPEGVQESGQLESDEPMELLSLIKEDPGKTSLMAWEKILEILNRTSIIHYAIIAVAAFLGFLLGIFVLDRRIRSKHGGYRIW